MRCDTIHPLRCSAIQIRFDSTQCDSICNMMQWINMITLFLFSDRQQNHNYCLLTSKKRLRGLFHKTSLPNRPGLYQLSDSLSNYLVPKANLTKDQPQSLWLLMLQSYPGSGQANCQAKLSSLTLSHTIIAMQPFSGFITAIPFIAEQIALEHSI